MENDANWPDQSSSEQPFFEQPSSEEPSSEEPSGASNEPRGISPEDIRNLQALASNAHLFLGAKFGKLEGTRRKVATFQNMKDLKNPDLDNGVKNHLVTLGFFDLSRVLLGYTYGAEVDPGSDVDQNAQGLAERGKDLLDKAGKSEGPWPDANFCAFGAWASLTIGRNVRNRFAPRRLDHTTSNAVRGVFSRLAVDVRQTNNQRLSRLLTAAQHVVFDELRMALKALLERDAELEKKYQNLAAFPQNVSDKAAVLCHLEKIEVGMVEDLEPLVKGCCQKQARNGRDERYADLQHGLLSYFLARQASRTVDPDKPPDEQSKAVSGARSELIFRGNVLIESYVQTKVQNVLDYSVDEIASGYFKESIGVEESENRGAGRWRRRINRSALQTFERRLDDVWPRFLTDQILVARVGDEIIRLGRDLPDPPGSASFFPPDLDPLADNWSNNLVLRFDHSFGYGVGTRSHNWTVYDDRMNWLVSLLRSRQQSPGVWNKPFVPEEEVTVRAHQDPTDQRPGRLSWMR